MHTLILLGDLDRVSAPRLEAELERLRDAGVAALTLDLSKLSRIDATGVAVVAFRCSWYRRKGSELALVTGEGTIHDAFERAGQVEQLMLERGDAVASRRPPTPVKTSPQADRARPPSGNSQSRLHLAAGGQLRTT